MSQRISKMYVTALSCLAAAALMAGCGEDEPRVTCGDGTKNVDNNCVLESTPVNCGEGTTLTNGVCVPNVACGPGTSADATGECVPDFEEVECAEGTVLDGSTCVPDTGTVCEEGTHADNGRCVADVVCGSGTTARDGECLSNDDLLGLDADVTEEDAENDPTFGGTPQTLTLPAASETLTLAGGFGTPEDKDNDGFADQDFDAYAIAAEAGDYLRIEAIDNGAGSLTFMVQGPNGFARFSPTHQASGGREVFLPYDGTYTVTVGPTSHFLDGSLGAQGGDDANYLLAVENLGDFDLSSAVAVDAAAGGSATGNFVDLSDNLVAVNAAADTTVKVAFPELGVDAGAAAIVLNANGDVLGEQLVDKYGFVRVPASDDDLLVLVDYASLFGARDAFTLAASTVTADPISEQLKGTVQLTEDEASWVIPAGDSIFFELDVALEDDAGTAVPTGLVETVVATSDIDTLAFRVYDPNFERLAGFNTLSGFHAAVGGTYILEVINTDRLQTAEVSALSFASYVPADLGTFDATSSTTGDHSFATLPLNTFRLITFETTEAVSATLASVQNSSENLQLFLLTDDLRQLAGVQGQAPGFADLPIMEPGRYFGLVYNPSGIFGGGNDAVSVNTTLTTSAPPAATSEPNNVLADATQITTTDEMLLGTLTGGPMRDYDIYEIATGISEPTLVQAGVYPMSDAGEIAVELRDENGNLYDASAGAVGAVLQPGTSYYVHVYRTSGFDPLSYLVEVTHDTNIEATLETEGNETDADASGMATLLNPLRFVGGGTLAAGGDTDWYSFNLATGAFMNVQFDALGALTEPTDVEVEVYEDDGTGNLTMVPMADLVTLEPGMKYLKVTGGTASGYANSYSVRASVVSPSDLSQLPVDELTSETGTFGADALKLFRFEIGSDLPADGSQTAVVWSDAELEILDDAMQPIHTATASAEFDGGYATGLWGTGFSSTTLAAGTYYVRLSGEESADWQLLAGILATTNEAEQGGGATNDTGDDAESLGVLSQGTIVSRFGSVDATDAADWFSFEVPDVNGDGTAVDVAFEHMQFGESINDIDIYATDTPDGSAQYGSYSTPQFFTAALEPGVYYVWVEHYTGTYAGDYLMRVYLP